MQKLREREERLGKEGAHSSAERVSSGGMSATAYLDMIVLGAAIILLVFALRLEYRIDVFRFLKEWILGALDPGKDPMHSKQDL